MAKFDIKTKSRTFVFLAYGQDNIDAAISELNEDIMPFCYIVHDQDEKEDGSPKEIHAHFMLDYGNTTTVKHIKTCYEHLAANGVIFPVFKARQHYNYLWHDQTIEKAKGKHVYSPEDIKCYNGFDYDDLADWTENEKMCLMDGIMKIANDEKIYEYAGLLEYLSQFERRLYKFAINNTILVNGYVTSHRNRNKKS